MKKYLVVMLVMFFQATFAQQVQNVKAIQVNEDVIVSYDLIDTKPVYVSLYYSKDGGVTFSPELRQVAGDVKDKVRPGSNKKISWAVAKELAVFDGEMVFKVEASSKKIGYPKPVSDEFFLVEVTKAFFEGTNLKIEFKVMNVSETPVINSQIDKNGTLVLDDQGNAFNSPDIKLGNKSYYESIEFSKDVWYKGFTLLKNINPEITMFSLLKLNMYTPGGIHSYSIKNIPISK